jgi:enoyl-CoA hydratase/carnithine racemase
LARSTTATTTFTLDSDSRIARIGLNRPERLNAIDSSIIRDLKRHFAEISGNKKIRVAIISGNGRAFSSGADIKQEPRAVGIDFYPWLLEVMDVFESMRKLRVPIIAQVHGYCLGMGFELAMASDLIYASEDSVFGCPEVNLGLSYGVVRLSGLIGEKRAAELCFTGEYLSARDAEKYGVINKCVPAPSLKKTVQSVAEKLSSKSTSSLMLIKHVIRQSPQTNIETALMMEALAEGLATTTEAAKEGLRAFVEKRKPCFN